VHRKAVSRDKSATYKGVHAGTNKIPNPAASGAGFFIPKIMMSILQLISVIILMLIIGYFVNKWQRKASDRIDKIFDDYYFLNKKIDEINKEIENYEN
jgi:uncharacterized membrane protein